MAKNNGGVNYIRHLLSISEKFIDDQRLSPLHISLYYALFQSWNLSKFRNPISVSRDELMRASKIGSANTYTKCLKELDAWEYIKYLPSFNPHKGSKIYLYNFNNTNDNATDISIDKSSAKTADKAICKTPVKAVIPSINKLNNTNNLNNTNEYEHKRTKNNRKYSDASSRESGEKEKVHQKKTLSLSIGKGQQSKNKPTLQELKKYFAGCEYSELEAEKFYNYYQSNGWLVGGKTPMKSWKSSAKNWMLNAIKFSNDKKQNVYSERNRKATAGKLHTSTDKNYSEPL